MTAEVLAALPVIVLVGGAALVVLLHVVAPADERAVTWLGAVIALGAAVAAATARDGDAFGGLYRHDPRSVLFTGLVCGTTALALLSGLPHTLAARSAAADISALLLVSAAGAVVVAGAQDLAVALGGLVLLWLPLLAARHVTAPSAREAARALPLFVLSSLALLGAGVALRLLGTGSTVIGGAAGAEDIGARAGTALVLVGLADGVAFAPASLWSWHARTATHAGIAAFRILVPPLATFALLLRLAEALTLDGAASVEWRVTIAVFAAATVALPTLAALVERSPHRIVAYAATAQLGAAAVALASGLGAAAAVGLALTATVLTTCAAVAALAAIGPAAGLEALRGLARERPLTTGALGVVLLAVAGIPPTLGFAARASVLEAAAGAQLGWLAVITAVAGAGWGVVALRVAAATLGRGTGTWTSADPVSRGVVVACAVALGLLGVVPGPVLELMERARY